MSPFEEPLGNKLYQTSYNGLGADKTADTVGTVILAATAIGIAAHAVVSSMTKSKTEE